MECVLLKEIYNIEYNLKIDVKSMCACNRYILTVMRGGGAVRGWKGVHGDQYLDALRVTIFRYGPNTSACTLQ